MKIGIGNDHAAVELKNIISEHLKERGCEVVNFGTDTSESFDYPIAGYKVGKAVANGDVDLGILICGTGVGISLAANKVEGVRAVVCSEPFSAKLSRMHNNTNVLAFGARVVGSEPSRASRQSPQRDRPDPRPQGRRRSLKTYNAIRQRNPRPERKIRAGALY